jgi:putative SOS response-associated peptidase YedK
MTGVVIGIAKVQRQGIRSGSVVAPKRLSSGRSWRLCKSCTMIITEPNEFVAEAHDRMPVLWGPISSTTG